MKVLCVCAAGMVRSQALVFVLKANYAQYGVDALACGVGGNGSDTLQMLYEWAQVIIVLDGTLVPLILEPYRGKVLVFDVGPDRWHDPGSSDLHNILRELCRERIQITGMEG